MDTRKLPKNYKRGHDMSLKWLCRICGTKLTVYPFKCSCPTPSPTIDSSKKDPNEFLTKEKPWTTKRLLDINCRLIKEKRALQASLTAAEDEITKLKKTQCRKEDCPHAGFWKME